MKKSECVNILSQFIGDLRNLEGLSDIEMTEDLLDILDDMGFLPPDYLITTGEREGCWVNEWEKEQ